MKNNSKEEVTRENGAAPGEEAAQKERSLATVEKYDEFWKNGIGHIEFSGLSDLKTNFLGGYDRESVLDIIDKIIVQAENQLSSIKEYATMQEENNIALARQNEVLRDEISKLLQQIQTDQEHFALRTEIKDEHISLLQRENGQLQKKIEQDKKALLEKTEQQVKMLAQDSRKIERTQSEELMEKQQEAENETEKLLGQVTELLNSEFWDWRGKKEQKKVYRINNDGKDETKGKNKVKKVDIRAGNAINSDKKESDDNYDIDESILDKIDFLAYTDGGEDNWDLDSIFED